MGFPEITQRPVGKRGRVAVVVAAATAANLIAVNSFLCVKGGGNGVVVKLINTGYGTGALTCPLLTTLIGSPRWWKDR